MVNGTVNNTTINFNKLINGKKIANNFLNNIKTDIDYISTFLSTNRKPLLVVIMIGDNKASEIYVKKKQDTCEKIGINFKLFKYSNDEIDEINLIKIIKQLNIDDEVNGYIIQLPLPEHINIDNIIKYYDPNKDVDCFHPENIGSLSINNSYQLDIFYPPTPAGVLHIIDEYNIDTQGKIITIIGKSMIVGKPLSIMLNDETKYGATVIVCDKWTSKYKNIERIVKMSDILIVCAGVKHLINNPSWIKDDSILIDVGIHRIKETQPDGTIKSKIVGDIDTKLINTSKLKYLSPSPGGCGALTVSYLCHNVLKSYIKSKLINKSLGHNEIIKKLKSFDKKTT